MREPELLLELLREMAAAPDGRSTILERLNPSENQRKIAHHIEVLADAGHVVWNKPKIPRITSQGYDFIECVDNNPRSMEVFINKLKAGIPFARAVIAALEFLK